MTRELAWILVTCALFTGGAFLACGGAKATELSEPSPDGGMASSSSGGLPGQDGGSGLPPGPGPGPGPGPKPGPIPPPPAVCDGGATCDRRDCTNSACDCPVGGRCELSCSAAPCQVTCGVGSVCSGTCANGVCTCNSGASCGFTCGESPCNVVCDKVNPRCTGTCADGECRCGDGSSCAFTCLTPPCLVTCEKNNPSCSGTCSNNTCTCGENSVCRFACGEGGSCHVDCAKGARCVVDCRPGTIGTEACDISRCETGQIKICPDGKTTTCGVPCP